MISSTQCANLAPTRQPEGKESTALSVADSPIRSILPKVFLMVNSFEVGGSERQFVTFARALDRSQFPLHLGCLQAKGGFKDAFGTVAQFALGGSLYKLQSLRARWQLSRYLREHKVAIAHAFDFYTNLILIPAARIARVPVVIGSHRQIGDLLTPAQFQAQAFTFGWCDTVVCNSLAAAKRLLSSGVRERKIRVIGNAIGDEFFPRAARAASDGRCPLRIGMIARMNARYKNHPMFLRVAAKLAERFPNVEFILAGDGALCGELKLLVRDLGIDHRVQFLGERQDIPAILASLDIVVIPSTSESLSNVALESMAAGLPVVASCVGGNPELLDGGRGVLFPPGNDAALHLALQRLVQDYTLRACIGDRAREFARTNFSVDRITRQYQALYFELFHRSKRVRCSARI